MTDLMPDERAPVEPNEAPLDGPGSACEVTGGLTLLRRRVRTAAAWALTGVAFLVVWFALVAPNELNRLGPVAFLRVPVEGLLVIAVCLYLPTRWRQIVAVTIGLLLGLLAIVKILDMGFYDALDRPFNPVSDWSYLGPAVGVLRDSIGPGKTLVVEIGSVLLVAAIVIAVPLSLLRLTRLTARYRLRSARAVTVLGVVWVVCAGLGLEAEAGVPIASGSAASLAYDQVHEVRSAIKDQRTFESAIKSPDPYAITPGADLLTGLRGKDVLFVFIESYGQVAVQGSAFSPAVDATLKAGTEQLRSAGFSSQSAFLTSPTFGGISWLAHSTLQSGLWVNNQQRYNQLVDSGRFTLSDAFRRAGWRTVGDVPSNTKEWPEGKSFYHYDQLYDENNVGYAGPKFSYASMPDQYTLAAFQRLELANPDHAPVMAEIDLVSSHTPWTPLPQLVDWNKVGDGSIYRTTPSIGGPADVVWRDSNRVKDLYGKSIQYSMNSLLSFVQNVHDDNLVVVALGDHQPATIVSGSDASHEVPITIIAHDPAVMDQISTWGWQDGLLPDPHAPVWPMDAFRNRFLTAYGN
jgi:hypothetical protein